MNGDRGAGIARPDERIIPLHAYGIIARTSWAGAIDAALICRRCQGLILAAWSIPEDRGLDALIRTIREHEEATHR